MLDLIGIGVILFGFGLFEGAFGRLGGDGSGTRDGIIEFGSMVGLVAFTKPMVALGAALLLTTFLPQHGDALAGLSLPAGILVYLVIDDFGQYWYHRAAHTFDWMWKLHRAHHSATRMGVFVTYRNGFFYYWFLPNLWWAGIAVWLGMGEAVMYGLLIKQTIVITSHAAHRWDRRLYQQSWLSPLMWVVERIIVTPSTHAMHHGKSNRDGISNNNGNFGNMLFVWDQLFGTAKISRQYPQEYGVEHESHNSIAAELFYPLIGSTDPQSELRPALLSQDPPSHVEKLTT